MAKRTNKNHGEKGLNIYWKIKNFSYGLENVRSPIFTVCNRVCCLELNPKDVQCEIVYLGTHDSPLRLPRISFVPCDGSKEISWSKLRFPVSRDIIFGPRTSAFLPDDTLTVLCRFWYSQDRGTILIRSRIGVNRKCFLWTLKKFSKERRYKRVHVENSRQFGDMQLNLKNVDEAITDEELYIEISRNGGQRCYCSLKFSMLDVHGKAINHMKDEFVFEKEDKQQFWKFSPVISKGKLLNQGDLLLPNDTLSLKCEFAISLGTITEESIVFSYFRDVTSLLNSPNDISKCFKEGIFSESNTDLTSDLEMILDDGTYYDASLQVGLDIIKVHKLVLSASSSIFDDIFKKDSEKEIDFVVIIEDLDPDTLRRLLYYMYTDAIHDYQWEHIMNLYIAAVRYEVLGLKLKCSSFLKANLTLSNVCEVLVLANLHLDADLISEVQGFISNNNSEVFNSKEWKELEKNNSTIALQTLREIFLDK